jgi:hypothetical protein
MIYGSEEAPNAKCTLKVTARKMVCAKRVRPMLQPSPVKKGHIRHCNPRKQSSDRHRCIDVLLLSAE